VTHSGELNVSACPTDPDHPHRWSMERQHPHLRTRVLSLVVNIEQAAARVPSEALNNSGCSCCT